MERTWGQKLVTVAAVLGGGAVGAVVIYGVWAAISALRSK